MATGTIRLSSELETQIKDVLKPMHRKFVEIDSSFARRIMNEGGLPAIKRATAQSDKESVRWL
jgi:hypothetical protein